MDSPSLDGLRIRVLSACDPLTQGYQLRFRLSHRPWRSGELCHVVPLRLEELGEGGALHVEALAPTQRRPGVVRKGLGEA